MTYCILVAEDDPDIVELLKLYLENEGYRLVTASNGIDALEAFRREKPHLAILDLMMPGMNGYELTRALRAESRLPILILSAKNQDADKILGLNIGADDYLTKPFNPLEVVARVASALRRSYAFAQPEDGAGDAEVRVGRVALHRDRFTCEKDGIPVPLTPTEFKILAVLMGAPGRIFTKVQLYEAVAGEYFESDDNTMMVHISKLRDKLEDDPKKPQFIKTVRGLGYKFEKP